MTTVHVPAEIPAGGAKIMFIAEAPGKDEIEAERGTGACVARGPTLTVLYLALAAFAVSILVVFHPVHGAEPLTRDESIVRMVLQEAANEPFAGMLAVAGVAFDRIEDWRWPSTDRKVVYQRAQFTGMELRLRRYSQDQIERARRAVAGAAFGIRPCGTVLWYHSYKVKPSWRKSYVLRCRLGAHLFYGDK